MNYIYVDTKITGAIFQLIEYFSSGVFNQREFTVYFKQYKYYTRHFSKMFDKHNIKHCGFKRYSQIKIPDNSVIFYLFNAQSNCRMVSNRKCTHIFVTHGESNKVASIKPIIRIYDYIAVAGNLGINRYLHNKIFHLDDIQRKKIIMVGDTFIGYNNFQYDPNSPCAIYAPTWEGGIPEENYSSLEWKDIFARLSNYLLNSGIKHLVIQPHPNLGHRKKVYLKYFYQGIKLLLNDKLNVTLLKNNRSLLDIYFSIRYRDQFTVADRKQIFCVKEAFSDISAMETQFYAKNIPTRIFIKEEPNWNDDMLNKHYQKYGIRKNDGIVSFNSNEYFDETYKNYLLNFETNTLEKSDLNQRIHILLDLIKEYQVNQL